MSEHDLSPHRVPRNEDTTDAVPVVSALQQAGYQLHHLILRDCAQLT